MYEHSKTVIKLGLFFNKTHEVKYNIFQKWLRIVEKNSIFDDYFLQGDDYNEFMEKVRKDSKLPLVSREQAILYNAQLIRQNCKIMR